MTEPTITREDAGQRGGRYVARIDGQEAELVFSRQGDTVTADHTGVPSALEGRGIGSALLDALLSDARAEGFRILPRCSFVAAQAKRHLEWADLFVGDAN